MYYVLPALKSPKSELFGYLPLYDLPNEGKYIKLYSCKPHFQSSKKSTFTWDMPDKCLPTVESP